MYLTYSNHAWHEGNAPIIGAMDHAVWLGSSVFDGARSIARCAPDLDLHLQRVVDSAEKIGLRCPMNVDAMLKLCREGVARFGENAELYIRPLVFGGSGLLIPDVADSRFALTLFDAPLPPFTGFSACLSALQRPDPRMAPTDAKASCLYPNTTRALRDAKARGFDNAVVCDSSGAVAEFATANLFFVTESDVVVTPIANGTFLSGITRRRVITLLAAEGIAVEERRVEPTELLRAKEIFNTGNFGKVTPCTRYESHLLPVGPIATLVRDRYFAFARSQPL